MTCQWILYAYRIISIGKDENVSVVISHGAIGPLLDVLSLRRDLATMDAIREKRKLLEAVTRALKSIFACPKTPKDDIFMVSDESDPSRDTIDTTRTHTHAHTCTRIYPPLDRRLHEQRIKTV